MVLEDRTNFKECGLIEKRNIIVSLDVGSSTIKAALGELNSGYELNVLGLSTIPSEGFKKGNIVNIESASRSIDDCLIELERITGIEIVQALLCFSGISLATIFNRAVIAVGNNEISYDDKVRVLQSAKNIPIPADRTIFQVIERQYIIDEYDGVKDPIGMLGSRLEVELVLITAAASAIQNMQKVTSRINLGIEKYVYSQLLSGDAILYPAEKEMGVVIVDIGGGTTGISVYEKGTLYFSSVLPVGGESFTKDLAIVLKTSVEEAELIKVKIGIKNNLLEGEEDYIDIKDIQGKELSKVSIELISNIIQARAIEMADMIYNELYNNDCLDLIPGGIVLTGGGALLEGLNECWEEYLSIAVRLGRPENIHALSNEYKCPQNSVVLGGLLYGAEKKKSIIIKSENNLGTVFERIYLWFKEFFR